MASMRQFATKTGRRLQVTLRGLRAARFLRAAWRVAQAFSPAVSPTFSRLTRGWWKFVRVRKRQG
jgi:hypothetical protein